MLGKDEYFGEMALLSSAPRNATVRAAKDTRVAALGRDNFVKLLAVFCRRRRRVSCALCKPGPNRRLAASERFKPGWAEELVKMKPAPRKTMWRRGK